MDDSAIKQLLLQRFGMRVDPEMARYVLKRLNDGTAQSIPIMGGDSRTGIAVRQLIAASDLLGSDLISST